MQEPTGFTNIVAGSFGPTAVLWTSAALLLVAYVCGALFDFDNQIVVQRIIKAI